MRGKIEPFNYPMATTRMNEEIRQASEIVKDPSSISWFTYGWIVFLAMWGGIVRVIREVKGSGKTWVQLVWIFIGEMITSAFVGVVTFYGCEAANIAPLYTAMLVSIAGWLGVRALAVLEAIYKARSFKGD